MVIFAALIFFLIPSFSVEAKRLQKKPQRETYKSSNTKVGIIDITKQDLWGFYQILDSYLNDKEIKAILFQVEGGFQLDLGMASAIFSELQAAHKIKPVISLIAKGCVAGCYYAAAGAGQIIANAAATVGEIGAEITVPRHTEIKAIDDGYEASVNFTIITQGDYKGMFHPHSPELTVEQKKHLNEMAEDLYDQFCEDIAHARKLDLSQKNKWANGKPFIARRSIKKNIKLIDTLGTFNDVKSVIKKELESRGQKTEAKIVYVLKELQQKKESSGSNHDD